MNSTVREDTLLTVRDVARILKVPPSWVYEHTRERCRDRIPGIRLGKYWRFVEEDVFAWLSAKRKLQRIPPDASDLSFVRHHE